jgi:hypothetical protein
MTHFKIRQTICREGVWNYEKEKPTVSWTFETCWIAEDLCGDPFSRERAPRFIGPFKTELAAQNHVAEIVAAEERQKKEAEAVRLAANAIKECATLLNQPAANVTVLGPHEF